jgi:hypothetical protein
MGKYKPVPKVTAQFLTGLIVAVVVVNSGVEQTLATEIGTAAAALVIAVLPVLFGFAGGWLKTDTERQMLLEIIEQAALAAAQDEAERAPK